MDKKQRTKEGHEIPIPKRKDFDAIRISFSRILLCLSLSLAPFRLPLL
jgi:hypothetical protein